MIKHNKHGSRESGSNLNYPQQSLISRFSNQGRFPVCKTRRLDQMLSNVSASFNILWLSECIPYRCNAQVQESSEPPSLALENQLGHPYSINAAIRLVVLLRLSYSHEALGTMLKRRFWLSRSVVGQRRCISNSNVRLMPLVPRTHAGKLQSCLKAVLWKP